MLVMIMVWCRLLMLMSMVTNTRGVVTCFVTIACRQIHWPPEMTNSFRYHGCTAKTLISTTTMATTKQGTSRQDIMHILKGTNIDLSRNSKLSLSRLDDHLGKALDAAQRFSSIFPDSQGIINLSKFSRWNKRTPVVDAFTRRTWGAIFQDNNRGFDDPRQIAFARINQLIPDIGKEMDKKKLGYVVLKDNVSLKALIIRVGISTFCLPRRPN